MSRLHAVIGHERLRTALRKAHERDALPTSLLLHGPRGVGKQHLALWLARLTVCEAPGRGEAPCDRCGPCRMALGLEHPDIHWYFPLPRPKGLSGDRLADQLESDRHAELAEIRANPLRPSWTDELQALYLGTVTNIRRAASKRPSMADGPVFIIGQAESLVPQEASPEAANALLKLLEEPPGAARFILTSSEPGMLLATIRSRTVPLHVSPLPLDRVQAFLESELGVEAKTARWAATLGQGSPGRALAFLPDGDELGPLEALRRRAYQLVMSALDPDPAAGYEVAISFPPSGARMLIDLFGFVEVWLRDLAATAAGADELVLNQDARSRLQRHVSSANLMAPYLPQALPSVARARELARGNVNPQLVVSGLVRDLRRVLQGDVARGSYGR